MAISKITYKSSPSATPETWMDATGATAEAEDVIAPKSAMLANGVLTTGTGSGGGGAPQKVFEYIYSGGWHKINVTAIDYSTGVITLEQNEAPFTDSYSTSVRVTLVPFFEGNVQYIKYGYIPPELWLAGFGNLRGVLVGTNQIKLYTAAATSIDSLTDTGSVDLTKFQIWAETSSNHSINSVALTGFDATHRYRIKFFLPNGLTHKTTGIGIYKAAGLYGKGYDRGFEAITSTGVQGSSLNQNNITTNTYLTLEFRGVYYGYTEALWQHCPGAVVAELYRVSEHSWILDGSLMYAVWWSNTPTANTAPAFQAQRCMIYLNGTPTKIEFSHGNVNTILDGCICQVYDMGVESV